MRMTENTSRLAQAHSTADEQIIVPSGVPHPADRDTDVDRRLARPLLCQARETDRNSRNTSP